MVPLQTGADGDRGPPPGHLALGRVVFSTEERGEFRDLRCGENAQPLGELGGLHTLMIGRMRGALSTKSRMAQWVTRHHLRARVSPSLTASMTASTRSSTTRWSLNARIAVVFSSVAAGSTTRPLHKTLSTSNSPFGRNRGTSSS